MTYISDIQAAENNAATAALAAAQAAQDLLSALESISFGSIPDSSVGNSKLAALAVTADKLAAAAVASADKLADSVVTNPKLAASAVTSSKIAPQAVTSDKLATDLAFAGLTQAESIAAGTLQDLGGVTTIGATGPGNSAVRIRYDGKIQKTTNGAAGFGSVQDIATHQDHGYEVWITDAQVGVVANRPDLAAANSAAIASFLGGWGSKQLSLFLPDGDYFFSGLIYFGMNAPLSIRGQSQDNTRIHICSNQDGIVYQPGAQGGGWVKANTLTVCDLSIVKAQTGYGGASGGAAIRAEWPSGTDNRTHFLMDSVSIYSENSPTIYWLKGVQLTHANGSKINNVYIKGDMQSAGSTTNGNPFGMTQGVHYINNENANGCINHYISNISGGCMGAFFQFDGWYEGVYINSFEFVQSAYGVVVNGYSVTQNSNMFLSNGQADIRVSAVKATYCNNLNIAQCDLYKDGGMGGGAGGTPSNVLDLNNVPRFSLVGSKITNGQGTGASGSNGILVNGTSYNGKIVGNLIEIFPGTGACIALMNPANFWLVASNMFSASQNGVVFNGTQLYASDDNIFQNVATKFTNTGSNNRVPSSPSF